MPEEIPPSPPPLRSVFTAGPPEAETAVKPGLRPTAAATGLPPNVAAGLATLFPPVSSLVFLVLEKNDRYVRFWAMQGVIFGAVWLLSSFVFWMIALIFSPIPILHFLVAVIVTLMSVVLSLACLVVWIVMLVKSFSGQEWEIPILGKFARQQLAKLNF